MAKIMGSPYVRGNSDVIVSKLCDEQIEEGLIVALKDEDHVQKMDTGRTPFGVMGGKQGVGVSVVRAGEEVWVQCEDGCEATIGAPVYVVPTTGKITHEVGSGNVQINATFAKTGKATDGVVGDKADRKCALISFGNEM